MNLKDLRKFWLCLAVLSGNVLAGSNTSPFHHDALGTCYENAESFVRDNLGTKALNDPNIVTTAKGSWIWIVDQTASENYTWYLLKDSGGKACFSIYVPVASHVEFHKMQEWVTVDAFISPEADLPGKLMVFTNKLNRNLFRAEKCFLLVGDKNVKHFKRKAVSCNSLLD